MVTGYNVCPKCKKKYSPKNESTLKIKGEPICLKCYRKMKNRLKEINREIDNITGNTASDYEVKEHLDALEAEAQQIERLLRGDD